MVAVEGKLHVLKNRLTSPLLWSTWSAIPNVPAKVAGTTLKLEAIDKHHGRKRSARHRSPGGNQLGRRTLKRTTANSASH